MTGTRRSSEGLDIRRRKLLFRSWHRGMREVDLVLGSFADANIDALTAAEIDQYERLLDIPDTELLAWLTGGQPVPAEHKSSLLDRVLAFRAAVTFRT